MPLLSRNRGRARASSPSQSTPNARRSRLAELPEYEPLSCPMDNASRRALSELSSNNADMRKYEEQLKTSLKMLTDIVGDINDRQISAKARISTRAQNEEDEEDEDEIKNELGRINEEAITRLRDAVPSLSTECEKAVRDVIDLRVEIEDGRKALQDTLRKVEFESANAENRNKEAESGGDGDQPMEETEPDVIGPLRILKTEKEKAAADYAAKSLEQRYALDNDYIGFKRMWWDSVHSETSKPLPDASRWFKEDGEREVDGEEEELIIAGENTSIYCPLSMVVMDQPYTSKLCGHTFNKPAIVQFLRSQPNRKATCPQTGCSKEVIMKDFYDDQVMLRRIKRAQERQEERDENYIDADGDASMMEDSNPKSTMEESNPKSEGGRDRGNKLLADLGLSQGGGDEDQDEI